jgi:hypothetical protein
MRYRVSRASISDWRKGQGIQAFQSEEYSNLQHLSYFVVIVIHPNFARKCSKNFFGPTHSL